MPFNLEENFKYKTRFVSKANVVSLVNSNLSKASIEKLGSTLDIDSSEIEKNPDLLFVSADLFVSDVANKNGDLVDREGAIDLSKQVNKKYLNIEHEEEMVVGSLISPFFRKYDGSRDIIEAEDLEDYDGSIVVGSTGYVWRSVNAKLSDFMIEASDKESKNYGMASMSWEVYFNDFDILKGSNSISKGQVISDKKEINKMKPFLRGYGGEGIYENAPIHRLIKGEKLFLGAGIVKNPAADVKGILTSESEIFKNKNKKKSQRIKINVKGNKAMKISDITDYKQALASITNGDEVDVKTLASLEANFDSVVEKAQASAIAEEIRKKSEEYTASLTEKEEAFAKAEEARAELDGKVVALESAKADLEGQLSELNEKVEAQEKQRIFDERMTALSSEFNLEGEVAKIVAEEIKDIDEEAYGAWLTKFKVLAGSHVVKASADPEEEEETAVSEEVEDEVEAEVEEVVSEASEEAKEEVPSSQHEYKSLEEEFESFEFELEGK